MPFSVWTLKPAYISTLLSGDKATNHFGERSAIPRCCSAALAHPLTHSHSLPSCLLRGSLYFATLYEQSSKWVIKGNDLRFHAPDASGQSNHPRSKCLIMNKNADARAALPQRCEVAFLKSIKHRRAECGETQGQQVDFSGCISPGVNRSSLLATSFRQSRAEMESRRNLGVSRRETRVVQFESGARNVSQQFLKQLTH